MSFNSIQYLCFLPACLLVFHLLRGAGSRRIFLLLASYAFYASWNPAFIGLVLAQTVATYACAIGVEDAASPALRRAWLLACLAVNLGLLFVFKYLDFCHDGFFLFLELVGLRPSHAVLDIVLPAGISFYTFQGVGYALDVHWGKEKACRSFPEYALFTAYFPLLVAGPIQRAGHLLPQLRAMPAVSAGMVRDGLWLIALGFYKKLVIADTMAGIADLHFRSPTSFSGCGMLLAMVAYSFQVYCDFSGYSDIARGTSRLFGVELTLNFRIPFFARNIQEYWNRWHISLSSWVRDYVFTPLMTSGPCRGRTRLCAFLSMLAIGAWHGAAWKYLLFGAYHGALLVAFESTRRLRRRIRPAADTLAGRAYGLCSILLTFALVTAGFSIFGCKWAGRLADMWGNVFANFHVQGMDVVALVRMAYYLAPLLLLHAWKERAGQDPIRPWPAPCQVAALAILLVLVAVHGVVQGGYFIYFQF